MLDFIDYPLPIHESPHLCHVMYRPSMKVAGIVCQYAKLDRPRWLEIPFFLSQLTEQTLEFQ